MLHGQGDERLCIFCSSETCPTNWHTVGMGSSGVASPMGARLGVGGRSLDVVEWLFHYISCRVHIVVAVKPELHESLFGQNTLGVYLRSSIRDPSVDRAHP